MLLIDKYAYTNKLRGVNPKAKFILAFGFIVLSISVENAYVHLAILIINSFLICYKAKIPMKNYLKILTIPVSFLLLSIVTIVITFGDQNYLFSINIMSVNIGITEQTLMQGIGLFFRSFAALSSMFFLTLTTPMIDILLVLKSLKIPVFFIELMVLIYRLIFIFLEESMEIKRAQELRFGYINMKTSLKSLSVLIKTIFIRVMKRNEEMMISLECKLYDGNFYI